MADAVAVDPNLPVSHEQDGRILTGVGTTPEALAATMERHSPEELPAEAPPAAGVMPPVSLHTDEPKKTRGQRRFDELTREREEARREAETLRRERDELKARVAAPSAPAPTPAAAKPDAPPQSEAFSYPTFESSIAQNPSLQWEDWVTDRARAAAKWELGQVNFDAQIRSRIEADWAARTAAHNLEQVNARGRAAYPDFDAVIQAPHMREPWPQEKLQALQQFIEVSGNAEHAKYVLGKNPEAVQRLRDEPNMMRFAMALSQLIPSQAAASPASAPAMGSPVVPAPYQPVGASSKTTASPASELPKRFGSDFDKSGYRERRAAERGVRR